MSTTKKYKILRNDTIIYKGVKLYRIQALKSFNDVEKRQFRWIYPKSSKPKS